MSFSTACKNNLIVAAVSFGRFELHINTKTCQLTLWHGTALNVSDTANDIVAFGFAGFSGF
jgi:hypothetical protein